MVPNINDEFGYQKSLILMLFEMIHFFFEIPSVNTRVSQKFCNILVVLISLELIYHMTEAVESI